MPPALLLLLAQPPELGAVRWGRDLDTALQKSKQTGQPVLILFDEVPGCQTCVRYGQAVLRHPLLVEAIESLTVPVAIYNNEGGADKAALQRFQEPSWNNPVVRLVDHLGQPLAPRLAGDYSALGLVQALRGALSKSKQSEPQWLVLLERSLLPQQTAYFSMGCFWSGEACLAVPGVVATRTGFMDGREVVAVDHTQNYAELLSRVRGCVERAHPRTEVEKTIAAQTISLGNYGPFRPSPSDDKYQLRRTPWRFVPMLPIQATLANAALAQGQDPSPLFSPRQKAIFARGSGDEETFMATDLVAAFGKQP